MKIKLAILSLTLITLCCASAQAQLSDDCSDEKLRPRFRVTYTAAERWQDQNTGKIDSVLVAAVMRTFCMASQDISERMNASDAKFDEVGPSVVTEVLDRSRVAGRGHPRPAP